MRDAFLMRRSDSVRQLYGDVEEFVQRETVLGQERRQGLAANELHRDEVGSLRFFDGEDLDDVWVIECGDSFGFAFETGAAFFTFASSGGRTLSATLRSSLVSWAR